MIQTPRPIAYLCNLPRRFEAYVDAYDDKAFIARADFVMKILAVGTAAVLIGLITSGAIVYSLSAQ
ncbi:MAG TPA: hypothetical protein VGN16_21045 [Acidobacteriaceae bacterium]|jgi:hypothetical protein